MNVLELVLGNLIQEKNIIESELERVINNDNLNTIDRVNKSKELLLSLSNIIMTINLTSGYLPDKNKNNNEVNNINI
jgi:hypothetical protein